jgi:hypothetical protein
MAAEDRLVSAEEWFSGGERLPYDPQRASFDDSSPLRVFVRQASGAGTALTFLPGWPDGSYGWAKVDAELAKRADSAGHTHPWFTTPLFKSRAGGAVTWVGQHSRRAFAPIFRSVFSRSYRVSAAEIEQGEPAPASGAERQPGGRMLQNGN